MKIFIRKDIDGFFGLFIDNLVNLLVISFILSGFGIPNDIIYKKIIPGAAVSIVFGNLIYSYMAYRLAKKENRTDVTALPYGISTPIMFGYLFLIIGPVCFTKKDPVLAWKVGVSAAFVGGIIEVLGAAIGGFIRKHTPRAGLLGTLAGIAITWISMKPTLGIFGHPEIGFLPLGIILLGFVAKVVFPFAIPAGLIAILSGTLLAWCIGFIDTSKVSFALCFSPPVFSLTEIYETLTLAFSFLTIIIPLGIYNFLETMQNVESASAAGDEYNTRTTMIIDGLGTIVGSIFGSCFPTTVYIGHPGWKAVGARIGYSAINGIVITIIAFTGTLSFAASVIPKEVAFCILLYIGLVITSQAFTQSPSEHAPAVAIAFLPHIANYLATNLSSVMNTLCEITTEVIRKVERAGVEYTSITNFAHGAIITGMLLGSITAFLIDRKFNKACIYSLIASLLSFFGVIHSDKLMFSARPLHSLGYLILSLFFLIIHVHSQIKRQGI